MRYFWILSFRMCILSISVCGCVEYRQPLSNLKIYFNQNECYTKITKNTIYKKVPGFILFIVQCCKIFFFKISLIMVKYGIRGYWTLLKNVWSYILTQTNAVWDFFLSLRAFACLNKTGTVLDLFSID